MYRRKIYYAVKPLLPRRLRLAVRGYFARRKRERAAHIWPILESAGEVPTGWPGWPNGNEFAFVLTHDVEGRRGLERVRKLAELEMSLGFRSCFNFVPEGDYKVPAELRAWLVGNGFEVGVHDLHHDGKLYSSREAFAASARRINHYLREWGAVGYRSGFMLHNYDWHHDIEMLYDATSFDTDPFEPQPEGMGTIFPFFVPHPSVDDSAEHQLTIASPSSPYDSSFGARSGYVGLPYTLVQDSTLFLLLADKNTSAWERKLAWIAERGGMALANIHPDYTYFGSGRAPVGQFSVTLYAGFLRHVKKQYANRYWNGIPKEIAEYSRPLAPVRRPRTPRRIAMITYSHYEYDNRVRRYAEALAARGDEVEVLAVSPEAKAPRELWLDGVHVTRLVPKQKLSGELITYMLQVCRFCFAASAVISRRALARSYDLVHVHNMPDFVVFAALLPRMLGARIILDLHDLVPELFADKTKRWLGRCAAALLRMEEKISTAFAHHVIISNHLWVEQVVERSVNRDKCSVFINNVDERLFSRRERTRTDDRKVILFHGSLSRHQGVDLVIAAMPEILRHVPQAEFHVYGNGVELDRLKSQANALGLLGVSIHFHAPVLLHEMPAIIANADLGVVAKRADSFGNRAYSTKILEFMSQGVPVVLSRTEIDQFYFDDDAVTFFESGNRVEIAATIVRVLTDLERRLHQVRHADEVVQRNSWTNRKVAYLNLVDSLIEKRPIAETVFDQAGSAPRETERIQTLAR